MRLATIALVLLALAPARPALAHDHLDGLVLGHDDDVRWCERVSPGDAVLAIDSEDGDVTLLLTRDRVAMQLSDRTLHRIGRELRREERERDDDDCALAVAIKSVVLHSVSALLDHSAVCPLRELRDVTYEDGELVFTTRGGDHVFQHFAVHDERATRAFSERDARAFVSAFHRLRGR